jgi:hypothetical protein
VGTNFALLNINLEKHENSGASTGFGQWGPHQGFAKIHGRSTPPPTLPGELKKSWMKFASLNIEP